MQNLRRKKNIKYPYPSVRITTGQAVKFIAEVVYPCLSLRDGRKRVRERIRYAIRKGEIKNSKNHDSAGFFRWAVEKNRDWVDLASVEGLPRAVLVMATGLEASISTPIITATVAIPNDPQILKNEYIESTLKLFNCEQEKTVAQAKVAELEAEVNDSRIKEMQMRKNRSANGKKGGRPKKQ